MFPLMAQIFANLFVGGSEKRWWKWFSISYSIYSFIFDILHVVDLRNLMWLWFLLLIIELWEKHVLLSPSLSHLIRDFCHQSVSSCLALIDNWDWMLTSWVVHSSIFSSLMIICCKLSMSSLSWAWAWKILPKTYLFHFLSFSLIFFNLCWNLYISVPLTPISFSHHALMLFINSGWSNQKNWNEMLWV